MPHMRPSLLYWPGVHNTIGLCSRALPRLSFWSGCSSPSLPCAARLHPTFNPALGPIARYLVRVGGSTIMHCTDMHLATHLYTSCVSEIKALAHRPWIEASSLSKAQLAASDRLSRPACRTLAEQPIQILGV